MVRRLTILLSLCLLPVLGCTVGPDGNANRNGSPDAAPADAGGLLGFMETCVDNEDCESGLCYAFNQGGPRCSHTCTLDTECEAPSQGCNNMGVCKRPDGDNDHADGGLGDGGI